jgi:hypothetical protein
VPETKPNEPEFRLADRVEDRWETSSAYQSLKKLQENPRVKYVVASPGNACPACQNLTGTYPKDRAAAASGVVLHPLGCRFLPHAVPGRNLPYQTTM